MSNHTPGPWKVIPSWTDYLVEGPNGEEIIWQDGNYDTPTISKANAYLMAAAPDLLAALIKTSALLHPDLPEHKAARAAIAKALGEKE